MSAEMAEEAAEVAGDAAAVDSPALEDAKEEQGAERHREMLTGRRRTLGDAEESCVLLLEDLVTALFQEMQVRQENASLFARATQQACAQAFEGVVMSGRRLPESLDRAFGAGRSPQSTRQQVLSSSLRCPGSDASVLFLRRLLRLVETQETRMERELLRFPTSAARQSGGDWEWSVQGHEVALFLQRLLVDGLVSAPPSAVASILTANRESLAKEQHKHSSVTLPRLQRLLQKALEAAEGQQPTSTSLSELLAEDEDEDASRPRIFQTEVPQSAVTAPEASEGEADAAGLLLSSYLAEPQPQRSAVDRRASGQGALKPSLSIANPSQRAKSRKILLLLAPPPRLSSRWTALRSKMVLSEAESPAEQQTPASEASVDPAALSNIFSLGTPRQLSAQELTRRQDLLAQLDREAERAERRMTTTVVASMSLEGAIVTASNGAAPSPALERQFQQEVAANSTITTGFPSDAQPPRSPTRPQRPQQPPAPRQRGKDRANRSKFELEREPASFFVAEGSARVREDLDRLGALCSPIQRPGALLESCDRPVQTASTLAHLPLLESSRLAVGVSAVVRGVQKRGPRRNPSRKSRLQLHNYSAAFEDEEELEDAEDTATGGRIPLSPVRTAKPPAFPAQQEPAEDLRLPRIPAVSPIKASPHRKHVAFSVREDASASPPSAAKSHLRRRPPVKATPPVWEASNRSRNRHAASSRRVRKLPLYPEDEEEPANIFRQVRSALEGWGAGDLAIWSWAWSNCSFVWPGYSV
ncbi:hypothetical protein BBJ28_00012692 [Nothophytophthora sp. Chile5]|nr:hypothetical protein BBJ28_00012692 [Nothophytophthora sp. Chile5]